MLCGIHTHICKINKNDKKQKKIANVGKGMEKLRTLIYCWWEMNGLERWLSSYKHLLFLQRAWVCFSAPMWQLTAI